MPHQSRMSRVLLLGLTVLLFAQLTGLSCLNDVRAVPVEEGSSISCSLAGDQGVDADRCPCHLTFASSVQLYAPESLPFRPLSLQVPIVRIPLMLAAVFHPPALI